MILLWHRSYDTAKMNTLTLNQEIQLLNQKALEAKKLWKPSPVKSKKLKKFESKLFNAYRNNQKLNKAYRETVNA